MKYYKYTFLLVFLGVFFFNSPCAISQKADEVVSEDIKFVRVADISSRSEALVTKFITKHSKFIQQPVASNSKPVIDSLRKKMIELEGFTAFAIEKNFGYNFIESFLGKWETFIINTSSPERTMTNYTDGLVDIGKELYAEKKLWSKTKELIETVDMELPAQIGERTDEVLQYLAGISLILSDSLDRSLKYQNEIVDLKLRAQLNKDKLEELLKVKFTSLLSQRTYSLFNIPEQMVEDDRHKENNEFFLQYNLKESRSFIKNQWFDYVLLVVPFGFILIFIFWVKNREEELEYLQSEQLEMGKRIFKKPIVASVFFTLLMIIGRDVAAPLPINIVISALIITFFVLLASNIIIKALRWSVYFFGVLFMVHKLSELYLLQDLPYRFYHLTLNALLLGFVVWFIRSKDKIVHETKYDALWFKLLGLVSPVFLAVLVVSMISNIVGYLYFSFLMNISVMTSLLLGMFYGVIYSSVSALFVLLMHTSQVRKSIIVETYHESIVKYARSLMKVVFYSAWLHMTLSQFLLLAPVSDYLVRFSEMGIEMKNHEFTVSNFLTFAIILFCSWAVSNFIKVLLRDEILSRFDLPKGIGLAVSSLTYYTLITSGFFLALFGLGFDLDNLGMVMGALSVGIGFGLQNVVSNFISGLILIFERPITIGDVVKLGDVEGTVISIGIRSSQIKQFNGSTLIVPNSDLISNKVVNRTLDDSKRRFILTISTKPDVDPDTVLTAMLQSIDGLKGILPDPVTKAYFKGTHDQSKVFDLFYWVSSDLLDMKSMVSIKVHNALKAINIEVTNQKRIEVINEAPMLQE